MKVAKSLLLGTAAVLATVAGAQAADLPTRKAAPVQYVKICDAYGAGFFYIPGTDTCLRVGGLVLADLSVSNTPNRLAGVGGAVIGLGGIVPGFQPPASRDAVSWGALGRIELDARTQSPWGTVRSFIRVDSYFGSGAVANTGALANAFIGQPALGTQAARESTVLNKGFIQFAGFTMGRIQSMFDFYADAATFGGLRGSNQTVNGLAYTATFGGGFSATLSIEDEVSHRGRGTVASSVTPGVFGVPLHAVQFLGTRMPDIVANLRVDQPWGSAQLSGAIHRVGVGEYGTANLVGLPVNTLYNKSDSLGFAVQGGVKFNLPMLAPGDNLWLQATYAKGAVGYTNGSNFAFVNGVYSSTNYGVGIARVSSGNGWNMVTDGDCVWTYGGTCDKSTAFALTGVFTHFWTPTLRSWIGASYYSVKYSDNAINPIPQALAIGQASFISGVTNYREIDLLVGLGWSPIRGFTIGTEFDWMHGTVSRPTGLANDAALIAAGLPAFKASENLFRGRLRMIRAF
ncbi:MAG: porin [Methylobacteriaceae bacterium]|nr:porin [Methylobacteriaceae bacterium]